MNMPPNTETFMREIAELSAKINLLLAMNSRADADIARQAEELAHKDNALAQKDREVRQVNDELAALRTSLAELTEELAHKDNALARKEMAVQQLNDELAALHASLAELKLTNEAFRSSTIWRLTAPLRSVVKFLNKNH
jgi:septal ring factor EnvC (AmiA/AmiB activator)